jgi:hypothetical protein
VAEFIYLGITIINQNYLLGELKEHVKFGTFMLPFSLEFLSSCLVSEYQTIRYNLPCHILVLIPLRKECRLKVLIKCWGYLALREGKYPENEENNITKSFIICTL